MISYRPVSAMRRAREPAASTCRTPHLRRCLVVRAFKSSPQPQDRQESSKQALVTNSNGISSTTMASPDVAVTELVAQPQVLCSALAGFCLVAAGVFLPVAQDSDSSRSSEISTSLARPALEVFQTGRAYAAQAAPATAESEALLATATEAEAAANTTAAAAAPAGTGVLLSIDRAAHEYVTANTSYDWRALQADVLVSDSFIAAGIAGWLACTAVCLSLDRSWRSAGPLSVAWAFYCTTCGAFRLGDAPLVAALKDAFARVRPSPLHHTYSFPSGHTASAVFTVGTLVVVLLPLTMQLLQEKAASSSSSSSSSRQSEGGELSAVAAEASSDMRAGLGLWGSLGVWGAAWVVTGAGRVLADAHWVTDTLAGGLLAVAVVSALAQCCKLVVGSSSSSSGGESGL